MSSYFRKVIIRLFHERYFFGMMIFGVLCSYLLTNYVVEFNTFPDEIQSFIAALVGLIFCYLWYKSATSRRALNRAEQSAGKFNSVEFSNKELKELLLANSKQFPDHVQAMISAGKPFDLSVVVSFHSERLVGELEKMR